MALRPSPDEIEVDGTSIQFLTWGRRGSPGLLLVHGGLANAFWWAHLGPALAQDYRVAALSLSGMGHSGHRPHYTLAGYANELHCVAVSAGLMDAGPPVIAAHSFGTAPTMLLLSDPDCWASGAILIDGDPDTLTGEPPGEMRRERQYYPSLSAALARYRLMPFEPCHNAFIVDDIARASLRNDENGYFWAHDPGIGYRLQLNDPRARIVETRRPICIIHGEHSAIIRGPVLDALRKKAPFGTPFLEIGGAGHHTMISAPADTLAAIRRMADWIARTQA
ncbi:alpha/beta hydrolase [Sphingopyxis sp.]|jgi:pimeloyl-ACP methyl ester carboxylesterase|uniref:alpha/beta fold hydrolase n=1 Tax=Sphingopyxis sp. TaxID=1908224 RepID=UPI002E03729E|nr:alpha/beta hydrolase [Sphingopyxis sp.]